MNKILKEEIESNFSDISASITEDARLTINVKEEQVMEVLRFVKDKGYDHLALISCVDWIEEGEFELVYILGSYGAQEHKSIGAQEHNKGTRAQVILKTRVSREKAEFKTAIPIFKNAEFYEREIHEFFGINFKDHPNQKPLFLEREYKVSPFRKDFDTRKYVEETFDKIPTIEEHQGTRTPVRQHTGKREG